MRALTRLDVSTRAANYLYIIQAHYQAVQGLTCLVTLLDN